MKLFRPGQQAAQSAEIAENEAERQNGGATVRVSVWGESRVTVIAGHHRFLPSAWGVA